MAWKSKRVGGHPWRDYLTKDEVVELADIERKASQFDKSRRQLTARRNLIVNRAIHRAKYEDAGSGVRS